MGGYATNPDTNATSEITGSGTANYMAKFTAAQVIGNSTVQDDGTTVSTTSLFRVGNPAAPGGSLSQMRVGKGTAILDFGEVASGQAGIWLDQATPTSTNWSMARNGTELLLNGGPASSVYIAISGVSYYQFTRSTFVTSQLASASGAVTNFTFTGPANTGQTASTEINRFLLTTSSRQWATGAITTQREVYITSPTYSFVGASTITSAYTLYVEAPTAGSNATISSPYALGLDGNLRFTNSNPIISCGSAITIQSSSGANIVLNAGSSNANQVIISAQGTARMNIATGTNTSGAVSYITYSPPSNTGQTASTEINGFLYNSYTRTWAAGAITTQREQYIKTVTYAFASASTITNAYGMYIEAPTAGSNATITNNFALGLAGNLQLQTTTSSTTGVIFKGTTRFLHNFNPTGSTGQNLFLGDGAGNFTATWSSGAESTSNTGVGYIALQNLTTGSYNNCIGARCGQFITTGTNNNLQGYYTGGELITGGSNVAIGESSLRFGDGSYNVGVGYRALFGTTGNNYSNNVAIGAATGYNLTTGSNNIFIGYSATTGGITSGSQNILIGYSIAPQSVTASGQLSIGNLIFGQGISATGTTVSTGTVGIGIVAATTAILSLAAGTTAKSQINFASSTAPSSPVNGDMWFDGTDWKVRAGGVTYTLTKA